MTSLSGEIDISKYIKELEQLKELVQKKKYYQIKRIIVKQKRRVDDAALFIIKNGIINVWWYYEFNKN